MLEIKESAYKGTRILVGNEKRNLINSMIDIVLAEGCTEIQMPVIQYQEVFKDKVGQENNNLMFNFTDKGDRKICLAPEYTAIVQLLSQTYYKLTKNVKLFYVAECFRGEKPQRNIFLSARMNRSSPAIKPESVESAVNGLISIVRSANALPLLLTGPTPADPS